MRIKRIRIENFKRIESLDFELKSIDCLTGPNNSGKTTFLQALALFDFCLHACLSGKNGKIELKQRSMDQDEFYVLPVSDPKDLWTNRKTITTGSKHILMTIAVTFDCGEEVIATVDLSFNRYSVKVTCENQSDEWLRRLKEVKISYLPVFSMFLPREERRTPAIIADELARGRVTGVVRNLLLDLKSAGHHETLTAMLKRVFADLKNLEIQFDAENDRYITVTYTEADRPREFDIFSSGSGFQQFVYLFGFILLRQPTIMLLDEPDVHLHGSLQQALHQELQRFTANGKQVLFATHSRELIARMLPEQIVYLEDQGPSRLAVAYDVYDTLDRLGSIDPAQLALVQAYRRIIAVEDATDKEIISIFCSKCLGSDVWLQIERRIAFCYSKGNPCNQDMSGLREKLQQIISIAGRPLEMFVVADRDYHPDREALIGSLPKEHMQWHVWERAELENYFLNFERIKEIALSSGMSCSPDDLKKEYERLLDSSRDRVYDKLVKTFHEYGRKRKEVWDPSTCSSKAREYLKERWDNEKQALADAKEIVLPGVKRWLQENGGRQFSNRDLAKALLTADLPEEVHVFAEEIRRFAFTSSVR